jgi:hypothetical protein
MPDPQFPDVDLSQMLQASPDAQARQAAVVRALRGQMEQAPYARLDALASGNPENVTAVDQAQSQNATNQLATMGEKEQERRIQAAQALREIAAQRNALRHQAVDEVRQARAQTDTETQQSATRAHEAAALQLQNEEFQHRQDEETEAKVKEAREKLAHQTGATSTLAGILPVVNAPGSLPGTGGPMGIAGKMPAFLKSDKGVKFSQDIERLGVQVDKLLTGGNIRSEEMINRLQQASGLSQNSTDREIRNGVQAVQDAMKEERDNVLGSLPPRAQQTYLSREAAEHAARKRPAAAPSANTLTGAAQVAQPTTPPHAGMVRIRHKVTGKQGWAQPNAVPPEAEVVTGG